MPMLRKALSAAVETHLKQISNASKISEIRTATHDFLKEVHFQMDLIHQRLRDQEQRLQHMETLTRYLGDRIP